jgi:hypothetical protein
MAHPKVKETTTCRREDSPDFPAGGRAAGGNVDGIFCSGSINKYPSTCSPAHPPAEIVHPAGDQVVVHAVDGEHRGAEKLLMGLVRHLVCVR